MAKIIYGLTSFWLGISSLLFSTIILFFLFTLPSATYLFKMMFKFTFVPLGLSLAGIFFYYLQKRIFVVNIVRAAFIINVTTFLADLYALYGLYISI